VDADSSVWDVTGFPENRSMNWGVLLFPAGMVMVTLTFSSLKFCTTKPASPDVENG
jgi:hypothetical protein